MIKTAIGMALATLVSTTPVQAKTSTENQWSELGVETRIVFPNQGAIRNFEADGNEGVWLEDRQRRWYYVELFGPCNDLNFAQAIGFDTRGSSSFDKFSTIIVRGERCQIASLVTAKMPLPRKERAKIRRETVAAGKAVVAPSN